MHSGAFSSGGCINAETEHALGIDFDDLVEQIMQVPMIRAKHGPAIEPNAKLP